MKDQHSGFRPRGFISNVFYTSFVLCCIILIIFSPRAEAQNNNLVKPEVAEVINKAWSAYRNNRRQRTLNLLKPILDDSELPSNVYLLAGKTNYDLNQFSDASPLFRETLNTIGRHEKRNAVRNYLERSTKLEDLDLRKKRYSNFYILYEKSLPPQLPGNLNHNLEIARQRIGGDLELFPDHRFTVIVYTKPEFRRTIQAPVWSGGVFDGKIHLPYREDASNEYTKQTIYHEYTHALIHKLARQNVPLWFNEGLATLQEYRQSKNAFRYRRIHSNPPERVLTSLEDISSLFKNTEDREEARLAYEYSYSLLMHLKERYGLVTIKRILKRAGKTGSFEKAVNVEIGRSMQSLQFAWETWLDGELRR